MRSQNFGGYSCQQNLKKTFSSLLLREMNNNNNKSYNFVTFCWPHHGRMYWRRICTSAGLMCSGRLHKLLGMAFSTN